MTTRGVSNESVTCFSCQGGCHLGFLDGSSRDSEVTVFSSSLTPTSVESVVNDSFLLIPSYTFPSSDALSRTLVSRVSACCSRWLRSMSLSIRSFLVAGLCSLLLRATTWLPELPGRLWRDTKGVSSYDGSINGKAGAENVRSVTERPTLDSFRSNGGRPCASFVSNARSVGFLLTLPVFGRSSGVNKRKRHQTTSNEQLKVIQRRTASGMRLHRSKTLKWNFVTSLLEEQNYNKSIPSLDSTQGYHCLVSCFNWNQRWCAAKWKSTNRPRLEVE